MDLARLALLRNRSPMVFSSPPLCIVPSALHPDILPRIFYTKKAAHPDCLNFCKKNGGGGWIALSSFARTSGVEPDASHPQRFAPRRLLRNRHPPQTKKAALMDCLNFCKKMVVGDGFEPSKAWPVDLQSTAFDRSATPPRDYQNYHGAGKGNRTLIFSLGS